MLAREDGCRQPVPKQRKAFPPGPPRPWNNSVFVESSHFKKKGKTTQKTLPQACSNILSVNNLESKVTFSSEHSVGRVSRGQRGMQNRECTAPSPRHSQAGDQGRAGKGNGGGGRAEKGSRGKRQDDFTFLSPAVPEAGTNATSILPHFSTPHHWQDGEWHRAVQGSACPAAASWGQWQHLYVGMSCPAHQGRSCTTAARLQ